MDSVGNGTVLIQSSHAACSPCRGGAFWDSPDLSQSAGRVVVLFQANIPWLTNSTGELIQENLTEFLR
jgi:hypothetical protein